MGLKPEFKILANNADITATIRDRFSSLSLTDETGTESDTFELVLADHAAEPIQLPPQGAELKVSIGFDGQLREMGTFVVDEIVLDGPVRTMTIRARAAAYEQSKGGMTDLQTQKSRTWKRGTTIGDMVKKIAAEHGLQPKVSPKLALIAMPVVDQSSESDINLLVRVAKRYDAIAKPAGGYLMFVSRGDAVSASGSPMPTIELQPGDVANWSVTMASRESAGTAVAYWRDNRKAKRYEVTVGDGEPVYRIRRQFPDKASAEAAARAELRSRARTERTVDIELVGRADLVAETQLQLKGFRDGVDGLWLAKNTTHRLDSAGYVTSVSGEIPNSETDAANAKASESEQVGQEV